MKKKTTSGNEEPPRFKNHPFHSLKTIKASVQHAPAPERSEKTAPEKPEDAADLFLRSMTGVRKMDGEAAERSGPEKQEQPSTAAVRKPDDQQVFLEAMRNMGPVLKKAEPEAELPEARSSSSRMKQLRRGTIRIHEELDLHGLFKDEALDRLGQFIAAAWGRGEKAVLVITGKGINSPEGPVLQGAVSEWLRGKGRQMVAEFGPAPRERGGNGAFVVFLKSRS